MKRNAKLFGALPRFAMRKAIRHPATIAGIFVMAAIFLLFLFSAYAPLLSGHPYGEFQDPEYKAVTTAQYRAWRQEILDSYGGTQTPEKHAALLQYEDGYLSEKNEPEWDETANGNIHAPESYTKFLTVESLLRAYSDSAERAERLKELQHDNSPAAKLEYALLKDLPTSNGEGAGEAGDLLLGYYLLACVPAGVLVLALSDTFAKEKRTRMDEMIICTARGQWPFWRSVLLGAGGLCLAALGTLFLFLSVPALCIGVDLQAPLQNILRQSPYPLTMLSALCVYLAMVFLGLWSTAAITLTCAAFLPGSVLPMLLSGGICVGPSLLRMLTGSNNPIFLYTLMGLLSPEHSLREFHAVTIGAIAIPQPIAVCVLWASISAVLFIVTQLHLRRRFARGVE